MTTTKNILTTDHRKSFNRIAKTLPIIQAVDKYGYPKFIWIPGAKKPRQQAIYVNHYERLCVAFQKNGKKGVESYIKRIKKHYNKHINKNLSLWQKTKLTWVKSKKQLHKFMYNQ